MEGDDGNGERTGEGGLSPVEGDVIGSGSSPVSTDLLTTILAVLGLLVVIFALFLLLLSRLPAS